MTRSTVEQFAGHYIGNMKFSPVRLLPNTKRPRDDGWQQRQYGVDDFRPGDSLGLKSIDGVVVVDDDFDTPAVACADDFLPKTGAVYGRLSKPRAKRLYQCPDLTAPIVWKDLADKTCFELRVNHQDMAPPSPHPETGERLKWDGLLLPPREITADHLIQQSRFYVTARLLAACLPANGRHDFRVAIARVLLDTLAIDDIVAIRILEWACRLGGSDHAGIGDAAVAIRNTRQRLDAKQPARGATTIAKLVPDGTRLLQRLREIYGKFDPLQDAIEQMNETNAVVWQAGSVVVLTEEVVDGLPHLRFSKPSDMRLIYPQRVQVSAKGKPISKSLGETWLIHEGRRFYRGIEVAPSGRGNPDYYNMWRGWSVQPKKGEWPLFREHLRLVANHNEEHARYILAWCAETVQHPERPVGIALAFKGPQGVGKSTFAKWFGALFGIHFLHLDSENHLLGRFNAHLHNAIVLLADEAVWAGSKAGLGALKRMITEDTLNIERKGVDVLTVKNMLHMMIASNEDWVVPKGFDDRRFAIFGTSEKRQKDKAFFAAVRRELFEQGGLSALLYDLLEHRSDVDLQNIPETPESMEQKHFSAVSNESWWLEKLYRGALLGIENDWPNEVPKEALHADYITFLEKHRRGGRAPRATETQLGIFIAKRTPLRGGSGYPRRWLVPSLIECREAWRKACKWPSDFDWGDGDIMREPGSDDIPF